LSHDLLLFSRVLLWWLIVEQLALCVWVMVQLERRTPHFISDQFRFIEALFMSIGFLAIPVLYQNDQGVGFCGL